MIDHPNVISVSQISKEGFGTNHPLRLCSFFKMKKPLQAPSKSQQHCFKITLWTSNGLSEVVAVTARENTCN